MNTPRSSVGVTVVLPLVRPGMIAAFFLIFTMASIGLPGLSGFVGEFLIIIGTVVTLKTSNGATEVYSILGAWDSAPELGIVSYKAAIGQALLGKKVGESVQLPAEFGVHNVTIEKIEPFTNLDILAEKVHVLAKPSVS